jgi:hypothetical protein
MADKPRLPPLPMFKSAKDPKVKAIVRENHAVAMDKKRIATEALKAAVAKPTKAKGKKRR